MVNSYVSLDLFKSSAVLNITGTGDDARLLGLLENVGRTIDRYCNRHFYALNATRKFDGNGRSELLVPDLISVDSNGLKTDDNKDRTFETIWAATDYLLQPSDVDPTSADNPESRPYTKVVVDTDAGSKAEWPVGIQTVQIAGQWGWWRHLNRADETADAIADAVTSSVTVSSRADVEAGHTLLVDTEQLYVKSYSGNTLTVVRGVNGTTAASHGGGSAIDIYEYPGPIAEATVVQAARLWTRRDSAFASIAGFPDTGQAKLSAGLDADVQLLLGLYRKAAIGVGV